ncbi:IS3 family transposase, partial [Ornithinibacillus halotolerans]|uniref:IS3 family transposase n=1 Tax=Ornithinibacillus halotolerans TaxID=1274357 RepID=UPI00166E4040
MAFELKEEGFKLKDVLKVVGIPGATYHYHINQLEKEDPDKELKEKIQELFEEHNGNFGYRRIHLQLRAKGYKINHKKVQRIMRELGLKCVKFT